MNDQDTDSLALLEIHKAAALIKDGQLSAQELVEANLAAIERHNGTVNAVVTLCADQARIEAKAVDEAVARGEELGPLAGIPVGIKDTTDTAGIRTTYGCPLFADNVPTKDAAIVHRLKDAGAIVIAKTNTPEFATGANTVNKVFGATRNPWNTKLSAGGSSGGSAVGLATGMFGLAEGSDLGGSLRIPASFCGITSIRSTPGLVPYLPNPAPFDTFDVEGPMTRTVTDLAYALNVFASPHAHDPTSAQGGFHMNPATLDAQAKVPRRIAFVADIARVGVDAEIAEICRAAAHRLAGAGHHVDEIEVDLSQGRNAFLTLRAQWMLNRHGGLMDRRFQLGENLVGNIEQGLRQTPLDLANAENQRANVWNTMANLLGDYDALVTATTPVAPFPVEQNAPTTIAGRPLKSYIDWAAPTYVISLIGLPAASVPAGLNGDGLPIGLQIIGHRYDEASLLALARQVEIDNGIDRLPL